MELSPELLRRLRSGSVVDEASLQSVAEKVSQNIASELVTPQNISVFERASGRIKRVISSPQAKEEPPTIAAKDRSLSENDLGKVAKPVERTSPDEQKEKKEGDAEYLYCFEVAL